MEQLDTGSSATPDEQGEASSKEQAWVRCGAHPRDSGSQSPLCDRASARSLLPRLTAVETKMISSHGSVFLTREPAPSLPHREVEDGPCLVSRVSSLESTRPYLELTIAACAAARRAIGTRNGEQLT